jgi:hypothetical protein
MEIIKVETKEQLKELYNCSAMTWEGLIEEDFETALNMCGAEGAKGYVTKGAVMNKICKLTGSNAYPDDLDIFSIDKFKGLAIMYGARWMDDIIANNADRQGYRPF